MTKIYQPPYVCSLELPLELIEGIREDYFNLFDFTSRPESDRVFGNYAYGIADIVRRRCPLLSDHIMNQGLVIVLDPNSSTNIHIDQRRDQKANRYVGINFPIQTHHSITSFYHTPDVKFSYDIDVAYTTGYYHKEPEPILSFEMKDQAVLLNSSKFHNVTNLSNTETRIMLSISMKAYYSFDQCLEILKSLGYVE